MYFVNLGIEEVPNNFSKSDFLELLNNRESLEQEITIVEKSFPTSVTDFLQHSISVYAKVPDLVERVESEQINLIEKYCHTADFLLFQPNDYGNITHPARNHNNSHLELINARQAWDITKGDARVVVGISDSYLQTSHDDIKNKIDTVFENTHFAGPWKHGTYVTGCVAAQTDNNQFISSIGNKTSIAFTSRWGNGLTNNHNEILLLAQRPEIRVINLSWGGGSYSQTINSLYNSILNNHNTVVTAGAGNEPAHGGENGFFYPAAYSSVISVTSVGHRYDIGYTHPSIGKWNWADCHEQHIGNDTNGVSTHHHNTAVNICAPGYHVKVLSPNNTVDGAWGTSFASPIVAGVCALVVAVNPCLTAVEVKDIVLSTADPTIYQIPENQNYIGLLGTGRVDAYAAVQKALDMGTEYIQNKTYSTTNTIIEKAETAMYAGFEVTNTQAKGIVTVNSNANVTFKATHSIILSEGFEVKNNAFFEAKIADSDCW
jgi:subtilisin family serine protease